MAALLYLDVDDEITSAAARMRAATEDQLVLVLPYGSHLATSRINFRLLAREAEVRGRALEIVSPDVAARALAASAGLTVHPSVAAFEAALAGVPLEAPMTGGSGLDGGPAAGAPEAVAAAARHPAREALADAPTTRMPSVRETGAARRRLEAPRRAAAPIPDVGPRLPAIDARMVAIGLAVVLVLLLVVGGAAMTFLPTATIVLTPETERIGPLELSIAAQPEVTEPDPAALLVPARRFTYDVQVSQTFSATGVRIDEAKASGEVTFVNCNNSSRARIAAGATVATAAGVEFVTVERVDVDRAQFLPPDKIVCKSADVGVTAVLAGTDGNVAAGAISIVPSGFDPDLLKVSNQQPTSGGKHDEFPKISEADVEAARTALAAALTAEFDRQLADTSGLPAGTTLFPAAKQLGEATPSVDPATLVGLEQAQFDLGLAAQGSALGVDRGPLDEIARTRVQSAVDAGFRLDPTTVAPEVGDPVVASGSITFPVTVTALEVREVDRAALLAAIKGKPLHEARLALEAAGSVQIDVWPDWVTTIPSLEDRITLTILARE